MKFSLFQLSRKGQRPKNEDRVGYCYTRDAALLVLADGLGGHPHGEVAAQLAVQSVAALFQRTARPRLPDVASFLVDALMHAHLDILRHAMQERLLDSPRTTLVAAVIQDGQAQWIHSGDSRLYFIRERALAVCTQDHSVQVQTGRAASRNLLTTCLGSPIKPDFLLAPAQTLHPGDHLVLCSDGFWSALPEPDWWATLTRQPLDAGVPELVEQALRNGGAHGDNVTVLALHWESPGALDASRGRVSTRSIAEDAFTSTVQSSGLLASEDEVDDLDELAIERAVDEINAAIARSGARHAA